METDSNETRGIISVLSLLAMFMGMAMSRWENADGIVALSLLFFFFCGVVLRLGTSSRESALLFGALVPPAAALLFVYVAARYFGWSQVTGGRPVAPRFLLEVYVVLVPVVVLGIFSGDVVRRIARWIGSRGFIVFLDKLRVRIARIGAIVDEMTRLGSLIAGLKRIGGGGS